MRRFLIIFVVFLVTMVLSGYLFYHRTHQPDFNTLFADMSIGVPERESISTFTHPADAAKGDYFTAIFTQSDAQFHRFAAATGASEAQLLSSTGAWMTADSKMDPKYPWQLSVKAAITNAPDKRYIISMQGQQPYN
jgi:hypothetical protein